MFVGAASRHMQDSAKVLFKRGGENGSPPTLSDPKLAKTICLDIARLLYPHLLFKKII